MKTIVNNDKVKPVPTYPRLVKNTVTESISLMLDSETLLPLAITSISSNFKVGEIEKGSVGASLVDFEGSITLSN